MDSSAFPRFARALTALAVIAVLGATAAPGADAQVRIGAHGIYETDSGVFGAGPRVAVGVDSSPLTVVASLDVFSPEKGGLWGLNANLRYSLVGSDSPVTPYVGAGFNYLNESEEEEFRDLPGGGGVWLGSEQSMTGLNVLGGLEFQVTESLAPFTQVRYTTSGPGRLMLTGGVLLF